MYPTVSVVLTAQAETGAEAQRRSAESVRAQEYPSVELLQAMGRGEGMREAKGEYITFLNAGDVMASNLIGALAEPLLRGEADIAVCDAAYSFGQIAGPTLFQSGLNLKDVPLRLDGPQPAAEVYKRYLEEEPTGLLRMGAVLIPKALMDGLSFSDDRHFGELFVLPQLLLRCQTVYCISESLLTAYMPSNDFSGLFSSAGHLRDFYDAHVHKAVLSYKNGYRNCSYRLDRRVFESLSSLWLPKLRMFGPPDPASEQELFRRREWYDAQRWSILGGKTTFELLREEV